ncbi:winged helix-turn-helix domain-containing tetratricopeptide repeat protein [Bordetella bronchialis]|uniref:CadC-family transcriptional regulator n=1 Tax=Bordetella bronchialis TaxID=463025 RepID=A0A193FYK1_9BORD|nr:winged helix-turn-helix domain-containing tetratricopeptide repeat protein [Bordetella bronchialis]ANN66999.1 CadC-family transcriptional regulator [Bordetella bronchialis]ANN72074.1 CadC-family transcriptional regulator [Bordetella bronchialis]
MPLMFEDCTLDTDRRELFRSAQVVPTTPQVFDLLVYLACNRQRVVTRDDLLDGVWGGRIVSESTLASHINAARKAVGDDGQQQRVIRTVPRKGFRFVADVRKVDLETAESAAASAGPRAEPPTEEGPALPNRPSIAVLPFVNLSGQPDQEYLADGVVEDIIAALSRHRWLFVVSRNSSFMYKARAVDVKQVGRELGVRYVLEGSFRRAGNRVRITGQLVDAATGTHHWAGRFEGVLDDIFALYDQISESVVGSLAPQLEQVEIERATHKPTGSLDAYDYYLRGMAKLHRGTRESIGLALQRFQDAMRADDGFASAHAMAAWCHCWRKVNHWMADAPRETAEGIQLARRAIDLGKGDAVALTRGGHALAHLAGDLSGGIALIDRALVLNPNLASAWFLGAFLRVWHGETEDAIASFSRAMRLSPLDPELYRMQAGIAIAHLFAGRNEEAIAWAEKALRELPGFMLALAVIAASRALLGQEAEARRVMLDLRRASPDLCLANLTDWLPIHRPDNIRLFADGLERAGLPG